jgi:hypothetical protein
MGISTAIAMAGSVGMSLMTPAHTTYSFNAISGVIAHPLMKKSYNFTGSGVGQIGIEFTGTRTYTETAIGSIVIMARIPAQGGRVTIRCQQTSGVHAWLWSAYLSVFTSPKNEDFAKMVMLIRIVEGTMRNTQYRFKGMAFDKVPELRFRADGDMVDWVLNFASSGGVAPAVS